MKFRKSKNSNVDVDMTPMIDMTFQLIAFFMFTINFNNELVELGIKLPMAERARPPDRVNVPPLILNVRNNGWMETGTNIGIIDLTDPAAKPKLEQFLKAQYEFIKSELKIKFDLDGPTEEYKALAIVRADQDCPYGPVQTLIRACRDAGFTSFSLRSLLPERR